MAVKDTSNVIKHNNLPKINVGMVIFVIISLYIVFSVYSYIKRDQIRYYEVLEGSIVRQEQYSGVAIREEEAVDAVSSGYIHYYIQDGKRVAVGSAVYTVDETGSLESYLKEHPELTQELSNEQVADIRYKLSDFSQSFKNINYSDLYNAKISLDAATLEYSSISNTQDLDSVLSQLGINYSRITAEKAGVVSYSIDGYENLTPDAVKEDMFFMNGYKMNITKPGDLVEGGVPVYKLITSSNWSIVFPVDEEIKEKYRDMRKVKVHFIDKDLYANAVLDIYTAADGQEYGQLSLNELMEEFCDERFIRFEIVTSDRRGLKIPLSSITGKDFFVIPRDFMVTNDDGTTGFNRQVFSADGTGTEIQFVESDIYRLDQQYCYITIPEKTDTNALKLNDFIVRPGAEGSQNAEVSNTYHVGPVKTLQGVYNINRGFCVFRQIIPIEQNNEYAIVEKNTDYGISVYDHIVMDASLVYEGQLIYQ